jgi:hypothetical protein
MLSAGSWQLCGALLSFFVFTANQMITAIKSMDFLKKHWINVLNHHFAFDFFFCDIYTGSLCYLQTRNISLNRSQERSKSLWGVSTMVTKILIRQFVLTVRELKNAQFSTNTLQGFLGPTHFQSDRSYVQKGPGWGTAPYLGRFRGRTFFSGRWKQPDHLI